MITKAKKHNIWEIWSESTAESIFVLGKPNEDDVNQIWKSEWPESTTRPLIFKLDNVFRKHEKDN